MPGRRHEERGGSQTESSPSVRQSPPSALPLLHSLNCAALVVDANGTIVEMNASMEKLLGADLLVRHGRMEAADRTNSLLLAELIRAAAAGGLLSHQMLPPVVLRRTGKRPLIVQALPVGLVAHRPLAMLVMSDLDYAPHLPESRLLLIFGLTRAEARLGARLAFGDSVEEAAAALGISPGTARNQLKSLFAKTETSRQAQLVALLWRVARMAGGHGES